MMLTPTQVAFRMYIGLGTPMIIGSPEQQRQRAITLFNDYLETDTWPKDERELFDYLVKTNIRGFTYQDHHLRIKAWMDGDR